MCVFNLFGLFSKSYFYDEVGRQYGRQSMYKNFIFSQRKANFMVRSYFIYLLLHVIQSMKEVKGHGTTSNNSLITNELETLVYMWMSAICTCLVANLTCYALRVI